MGSGKVGQNKQSSDEKNYTPSTQYTNNIKGEKKQLHKMNSNPLQIAELQNLESSKKNSGSLQDI